MSGRIKLVFVLFLVIVAAYAGSAKIPVLFARPEEGVKKTSSSLQTTGCPNNWSPCYRVSLPFVAKNADLRPGIEITRVPAYNHVPSSPAYYVKVDGKVLNVNPEVANVVVYVRYYWVCWLREGDQGGVPIESDGSFSAYAADAVYWDSPLIRVYVIRKGYLAPSVRMPNPDLEELPPDPPTPDVWAMVEIERIFPEGWVITQRIP